MTDTHHRVATIDQTPLYTVRRGLLAPVPTHVSIPEIHSWGLGTDSSAAMLELLDQSDGRPLDHVTVLVAQTGDEWTSTGRLATRHILPRLRHRGVRLVQVARRGPSHTQDGVLVLDDSTAPTTLHMQGAYTLSQEMLTAGTVPQSGGTRLCSIHAKGEPLDAVIAHLTQGRPYRHFIGFEAEETRRAATDAQYNSPCRTGIYPLIEWGWTRTRCTNELQARTGARWIKSACSYCPFALQNKESRAEALSRFGQEYAPAELALTMEYTAVALNHRQGLAGGKRLLDQVMTRPELRPTATRFLMGVNERQNALYRVRRVIRPKRDDPAKRGSSVRALQVIATGDRAHLLATMAETARRDGRHIDRTDALHPRMWIRRRGTELPTIEEFLVVAPYTAQEKIGRGFDAAWAKMMQRSLW